MKATNNLLFQLTEYSQGDYYPFHMPGHKRAGFDFPNPWSIDITEIDGFDNLHHPQGILKELQEQAAALFGAKKSFCLVNGSTCGLLSAVSACVRPGGKLLMSRNCHRSVYNAVYLRNITPVYLMPETTDFGIMGSLSLDTVKNALQEHTDIDAVLVVSPTYDGVVSDIKGIADIAHAHGIPLIVDEAHGAHFPFSRSFPVSALSCGADVVIHSLHKTLPAFTQTALLHLNSTLVSESAIQGFLNIYQSSSPSYLLMASIAECLQFMKQKGSQQLNNFCEHLNDFYKKCASLKYIQVYQNHRKYSTALFDRDASKILISPTALGLSGQDLYNILRDQYHLQLEMASGHYALALASLMDTPNGFARLFAALQEIEQVKISGKIRPAIHNPKNIYGIPQQKMSITEAINRPGTSIPLEEAAGAVSQEYLCLYPPGIPIIAPGEIIDSDLLSCILSLKSAGFHLTGLSDLTNTRINIVNF